jgi:hypothetical protein
MTIQNTLAIQYCVYYTADKDVLISQKTVVIDVVQILAATMFTDGGVSKLVFTFINNNPPIEFKLNSSINADVIGDILDIVSISKTHNSNCRYTRVIGVIVPEPLYKIQDGNYHAGSITASQKPKVKKLLKSLYTELLEEGLYSTNYLASEQVKELLDFLPRLIEENAIPPAPHINRVVRLLEEIEKIPDFESWL